MLKSNMIALENVHRTDTNISLKSPTLHGIANTSLMCYGQSSESDNSAKDRLNERLYIFVLKRPAVVVEYRRNLRKLVVLEFKM